MEYFQVLEIVLANIAPGQVLGVNGTFTQSKRMASAKADNEVVADFERYGFTMILLSRVLPILPEVSACMSGISKMKFSQFFLAWTLNTIPYGLIAAYSGSISSINNPKPAIYAAIAMYAVLWSGWFLFKKYSHVKN